MGNSIFLKAKTRDPRKEEQLLLFEENGSTNLSDGFTSFVTRDFENGEQMQIKHILDIDLSVLRRRPVNVEPDTGELEYRLFLAEEEDADEEKAAEIQIQIKQTRTDWEATYDQIQDGWTLLTEMQQVVKSLLIKIEDQPDFDRRLTLSEG